MKVFPFFPATDRRIFFSSVSPALERQSNSWDLLSKSPGKAKFPFSAKVPRNQLDFPSQSLLFKENLLPKEVDESSRRDPENKSQSFVFLKRLFPCLILVGSLGTLENDNPKETGAVITAARPFSDRLCFSKVNMGLTPFATFHLLLSSCQRKYKRPSL